MHSRTNNVSGERFNLIAVVMIAVLAVSVAIAWFTTRPKTPPLAPSLAGTAIIAEISEDTLDTYWSADHKENYFVIINRKKTPKGPTPVGWKAVSHKKDPSGGYSGTLQQVLGDDFAHKSTWTLSADLSQGQYSASGPKGQVAQVETQITLKGGTITVTRNVDGKTETASTSSWELPSRRRHAAYPETRSEKRTKRQFQNTVRRHGDSRRSREFRRRNVRTERG